MEENNNVEKNVAEVQNNDVESSVADNQYKESVTEEQKEQNEKTEDKKKGGKAALVLGIIGTTLGALSLGIILIGGLVRGFIYHNKVNNCENSRITITQQKDYR